MLINFALDSIGTVVTSDKISTDNHECTNLVSSDWHKRRRGFIAEHFIKPPVNITFQFPCSIQIYQVFVTPFVGQQLSSNIEVYTASTSSRAKNDMSSVARAKSSSHSAKHEHPTLCALPTCGLTSSPLFYQVSKVSVFDYGRICFTNPLFGPETEFDCSTEDRNLSLYRKTMQHFKKELMMAASHLSIRLVQTRHGSSVAVSSVDIWGLPAISVPMPLKNNIIAKFTSFIKPRPSTEKKKDICSAKQETNGSVPLSEQHIQEEELSIPDEFIDQLTCEVMCIPMLLPCGKNVDLSTLNRFFDSEAAHGRAPRDPFTGVVFSENSKPISNIALKSRIDQFLFKHRDDKATSSVARTVSGQLGTSLLGKRDVNGQRLIGGVSSLVSPNTSNGESMRVPVKSIATSSRHSFPSSSNYSVLEPTTQKESDLKTYLFTETSTSVSTKPLLTTSSCVGLSSQNEPKSHEQNLKDSLNSALASILNSSSTESKKISISYPSNKPSKCSFCKKFLSEAVSLYNSPCNHTVCRQCLTSQFHSSSTHIKCGFCGILCKREDFIRKHHY
ncbi:hypothetical protein RRG08_035301 [Elysia crispata]|uniref:U-box domain-containing protein n=1 Tax=Elysia crispata TaxID=231223 RepID=A0AAE1D3Q4_9GAST|nr:hypothetical protein RRG08_035301 [Elysia crispata]